MFMCVAIMIKVKVECVCEGQSWKLYDSNICLEGKIVNFK